MPSLPQQITVLHGQVVQLELQVAELLSHQALSEERMKYVLSKVEGLYKDDDMVVSGVPILLQDAPSCGSVVSDGVSWKVDEPNPPYSPVSYGGGRGSVGDMISTISSKRPSRPSTARPVVSEIASVAEHLERLPALFVQQARLRRQLECIENFTTAHVAQSQTSNSPSSQSESSSCGQPAVRFHKASTVELYALPDLCSSRPLCTALRVNLVGTFRNSRMPRDSLPRKPR